MKNHTTAKTNRISRLLLTASWLWTALAASADPATEPDEQAAEAEAVYILEDFTVTTGTRTERLLSEVPVKTDLLGRDALISAGTFELGQAMELLNGARTESNCQNCGTSEIQLLGLPGSYNQILVDGLPLFTGVASVYGIDQVPTIILDRIEVVKGGGSALYGPGAVAGVINLIPEEPFANHSTLEGTYTSIDGESTGYQGQFATHFVSEESVFKASIYGAFSDKEAYDREADGFTELTDRENTTVGTYLWWTPQADTRLRFNYQYMGEERRGGNLLNRSAQFAQIAEALDTDYHWGTLRWEQELTKDFGFHLSGSVVHIQRDSFYGGTGEELVDPSLVTIGSQDPANGLYNGAAPDELAAAGSDAAKAFALFGDGSGQGGGSFNQFGVLDSTSYFVDAQFDYNLGEIAGSGTHNLVFGIQYEREDLLDNNENAFGREIAVLHDDTFDNVGVYLQNEWQLSKAFELVPGLRIDKSNTLDDAVISPRIAARYTLNDTVTLRANYSTGFLAPRTFSEDIHIGSLGGTPVDTVNAANLKEERSQTFAFGVDYRPAAFNGGLVTAVQVYHTRLEDSFRIEEPTGAPGANGRFEVERINTDGSTISGIEWDLSQRFNERWSANVGLAYTHTRFDSEQEIFTGVFSDRYNKVPDWSGIAQLNYDTVDWVDVCHAVTWTGPMEVASATTETLEKSSDFFVVDLGVSQVFALSPEVDLTVRAGINNVFDAFQDDLESGAGRDSDYVYGPRLPRTFTISAKLDF